MKLLKLLTIPAVLMFGIIFAVPVSAHALNKATISVACNTSTGKICVTLSGDVEQGNDERFVFVDIFAKGSNTSLGEVEFDVPAFNQDSDNHFSQTLCFPAVSGDSFVIKVVKVTSDSEGNSPSDLTINLKGGGSIQFTSDEQKPQKVAETGACTQSTPTPTPSPSSSSTPTPTPSSTPGQGAGSPTPSPSAQTVATLANTGGFDFRLPLIGLTVIVAGLALFLVSASRGRQSAGR